MPLERFLERFRKKDLHPNDAARSTALETEIEKCLLYFEDVHRQALEKVALTKEETDKISSGLISIHGRKYTVGRLEKGYFWQTDDTRHVIGSEKISPEQSSDIIQEIQTITFSYRDYLAKKGKINH